MAQDRPVSETLPNLQKGVIPGPAPVRAAAAFSLRQLRNVINFSRRKPLGALGIVLLLIPGFVAIFAPVISPFDPYEPHVQYQYASPGEGGLPLGGDYLGRDTLSRLFFGARVSLGVGAASVAIGISLGFILGVTSAYYLGLFDLLIQRVVDAFIAFPAIILGLLIMFVLGPSLRNIVITLVVVLTPGAVRTVRAQALSVKDMDYVVAAKAVGCTDVRIIFRHIVPNCMAIFIVLLTITLGFAIIVEASLSFLGVGAQPDVPTWGGMLKSAAEVYLKEAPWMGIAPGIAIAMVVLGVNLLGDALRDVLDPRLRGAG